MGMKAKKRPHISLNVTTEILLRLPVRSLARFRRVSNLWRSITEDTYFKARFHCSHKCILFSRAFFDHHSTRGDEDDIIGITYLDGDNHLSSLVINPYFSSPNKDQIKVVGSCNGLILVTRMDDSLEILNPSTEESLTPPPRKYGNKSGIGLKVCFGFHPATEEYKIVSFLLGGCEVYTLGSSCWREIAAPEYLASGCVVVPAKGSIYWMNDPSDKFCFDLKVFDFKDELFTTTPTYDLRQIYPELREWFDGGLVELQGSACLTIFIDAWMWRSMRMDLLMLNHDELTWTRKYSVTTPDWDIPYLPVPLIVNNGKILVHIGDTLLYLHQRGSQDEQIIHDSDHKLVSLCNYNKGNISVRSCALRFHVHVESLVSLPKLTTP